MIVNNEQSYDGGKIVSDSFGNSHYKDSDINYDVYVNNSLFINHWKQCTVGEAYETRCNELFFKFSL